MTTPTSASAQTSSDESPVRTKLAAAAARAGARKAAPRRRTTARKTSPAASRNERAAKRGKYADRIAPAVKSGAALLSWKNPVAGKVIALRADAWAASLDAVAAEDPRVDALLQKISGLFGKGGAWGKLGQESALMVGGVMVATGRVPLTGPAGMVLALFAGALVEQATMSVAYDLAYQEAVRNGADPDGMFEPSSGRVAEIAVQLTQERADKAAERLVPADDVIEEFPDVAPQGHYTDEGTYSKDGSTVFAREGW